MVIFCKKIAMLYTKGIPHELPENKKPTLERVGADQS